MPLLTAIVDATRRDLPALRLRRTALERAASDAKGMPSFSQALRGGKVAVIAEIKRRSPSAGDINSGLEPARLAAAYQRGGASAISVLTNGEFFGGSMADLKAVTGAVDRPVLRKDFVLDEVQLLEARAGGAAAALLIARILDQPELAALITFASSIGLESLVEAHNAAEMQRALDAGARIVGVNARDLDTLAIDTHQAWELLARIPASCIAVAESGIRTVADVESAAEHGADAVLVGTALAGSADPPGELVQLAGVPHRGR